jgi:ribonuclease P protein component
VSVAVVAPDAGVGVGAPAQVAYAVGRRVGGAVVRNRVRRRLRAAIREHEALLAPGAAYLVSVGPEAAALPYRELDAHLVAALEAVARRSPGAAP